MSKFYGHTWILLTVAVSMLFVASAIIIIAPRYTRERELAQLERRAETTLDIMKQVFERDPSDDLRLTTENVLDIARNLDDLQYLIIKDESGAMLGSINEAGAKRVGYNRDLKLPLLSFDGGQTVKVKSIFSPTDSTSGNMYLGLSKASMKGASDDRRFYLGIGLVLFLLSAGIFISIHRINLTESRMSTLRKRQKDLSEAKGSLESEVSEQRKTQAELKESEQRYRLLFENAMESAFADLEALNKNLERQKGELETEILERTKAQGALSIYADRLTALNVIERSILSEEPIEKVVQISLEQILVLTRCKRASVLQFIPERDEVVFLGATGVSLTKSGDKKTMPLTWIRPLDKDWDYKSDLNALADRSRIEDLLLKNGLQSYCRAKLTDGEAVVGAINVVGESVDAFSKEDFISVRDVADLLSIALRQQNHREKEIRYNKELIEERDRANELSRLKTAFLANMSHEIRTPLSGIIGFAQVLHEEADEDKREFTGLIQDSAMRLLTTINSVLDLSKLEANKESFAFQNLDVSATVKKTVRLLESLADKKGLQLSVRVEPSLTCRLDKNALEGIVNNLVGNAIKFTEKGKIGVQVLTECDEVCIQVQDSGVGISADFIPYLFDEFRQEFMDADRPHEGSGLGLSITQKLVERMGGRIEVKSKPDHGTTFRVYFPASDMATRLKDRNASPPGRKAQKRSSRPA